MLTSMVTSSFQPPFACPTIPSAKRRALPRNNPEQVMDFLSPHESYLIEGMFRILWILLAAMFALLLLEMIWISILTVDVLRSHRRTLDHAGRSDAWIRGTRGR